MITVVIFIILGFVASLIGHYLGKLLSKSEVIDESKRVFIEYDSGESAKVEVRGELSQEQVDQLLNMIQEKFASPLTEQRAVPINP